MKKYNFEKHLEFEYLDWLPNIYKYDSENYRFKT